MKTVKLVLNCSLVQEFSNLLSQVSFPKKKKKKVGDFNTKFGNQGLKTVIKTNLSLATCTLLQN